MVKKFFFFLIFLCSLQIFAMEGDKSLNEKGVSTSKMTKSQKRRMRRKRSEAKREEHYKEWREKFFKEEEQKKEKSEQCSGLDAWKILEDLLDERPDESLWTIEDEEKVSSLFANFKLLKNSEQMLSTDEERSKMNENEKEFINPTITHLFTSKGTTKEVIH